MPITLISYELNLFLKKYITINQVITLRFLAVELLHEMGKF
jgi:hypothetical protein